MTRTEHKHSAVGVLIVYRTLAMQPVTSGWHRAIPTSGTSFQVQMLSFKLALFSDLDWLYSQNT